MGQTYARRHVGTRLGNLRRRAEPRLPLAHGSDVIVFMVAADRVVRDQRLGFSSPPRRRSNAKQTCSRRGLRAAGAARGWRRAGMDTSANRQPSVNRRRRRTPRPHLDADRKPTRLRPTPRRRPGLRTITRHHCDPEQHVTRPTPEADATAPDPTATKPRPLHPPRRPTPGRTRPRHADRAPTQTRTTLCDGTSRGRACAAGNRPRRAASSRALRDPARCARRSESLPRP